MFNKIAKVLGPRTASARFAVVQHSPELFLISGLASGVAAAVMLAKAHKKADETFEEVKEGLEGVHHYVNLHNDKPQLEPISRKEETKLLMPLWIEGARRGVILYGPSALMGVSSLLFLLASHGVLRNRNKALVATVTLLERGFAEYRKRVVSEYGEDADQRLYFGAEARTTTLLEEGEDGKKSKTKTQKNHIPEEISPIIYQRVFDNTNKNWSLIPDMNAFFLGSVQRHMNDQLLIRGYVLLNEVYRALDFAETPEGAIVGWSLRVPGDGYISFGLENDINLREGDDRYILDFNVSGVVFDRIGER